jgi:hypothetical protein
LRAGEEVLEFLLDQPLVPAVAAGAIASICAIWFAADVPNDASVAAARSAVLRSPPVVAASALKACG